jgi:hypothetical protein
VQVAARLVRISQVRAPAGVLLPQDTLRAISQGHL